MLVEDPDVLIQEIRISRQVFYPFHSIQDTRSGLPCTGYGIWHEKSADFKQQILE